jgi:hypothetical protein
MTDHVLMNSVAEDFVGSLDETRVEVIKVIRSGTLDPLSLFKAADAMSNMTGKLVKVAMAEFLYREHLGANGRIIPYLEKTPVEIK